MFWTDNDREAKHPSMLKQVGKDTSENEPEPVLGRKYFDQALSKSYEKRKFLRISEQDSADKLNENHLDTYT